VRAVLHGVLIVIVFHALPVLQAAQAPAKKGETRLNLKADSIEFDRSGGALLLQGKVRVTRVAQGETMVVHCDRLTGKMKDGKMEEVDAVGNVKVQSGDLTAAAASAKFDFKGGMIRLFGAKDKPASVKTREMTATGPTIVFFLKTSRVLLPDGGETDVKLQPKSD